MLTEGAPQVVGRDQEQARIEGFLDAIRDGSRVLLLEGEAGIGKTTLWSVAVESARRRSVRLLIARAVGSEAQLSYQALDDLLGGVLDDVIDEIPAPQGRALEIALLRRDPEGAGPDQRAVSLAALAALQAAAASGPIVVAVDDVQWLDQPSALVLEFCLRRLLTEPIGFLGSVRTEARSQPVALGLDRAGLEERLQRLYVEPLSVAAIHHVIRARLGTTLPRPTLLRLHQASGGNPLFAIEIGRALLETGSTPAPGQPLPVPDTLGDLMRTRLTRLPAPTREALLAVELLSHPSMEAVGRVLGTESSAHDALDRAVDEGVVTVGPDVVRFTHPLLASTHHAMTPRAKRQAMHRRLADAVTDPEEQARHLALGTVDPDASVSDAVEEAARAASRRGAPHAAAELADLAARLTPPDRESEIRRRTLHAGSAYFEAGDVGQALRLLDSALARSASGTDRAEVLLRIATVKAEAESLTAAEAVFREALQEQEVRPDLAALIEYSLAYNLTLTGDTVGGADHAREAVRQAEMSSDPVSMAVALGMFGLFEFCLGRGLRTDVMDRAVALEESSGQHLFRDDAPSTLYAAQLMWSGELDVARVRLRTLYDEATARGDQGSLGILAFFLSLLECRAGDYAAAAQYAAEDEDVFLVTERSAEAGPVLYCRAQADAFAGRVDLARERSGRGLELSRRVGYAWFEIHHLWVLGFVELSLGNAAGATEHLQAAAARWETIGVREPGIFLFPPDYVEALVAVGRLDEAAGFLDTFEELSRAVDRAWGLATAARCHGLLSAAQGDLAAAHQHLERALAEHHRVPMPFELGRTLLAQGQVLRRAKRKRPARESLERAAGIFDQLGTPLWTAKARAELGRIGGRAASPTELTPTERRVAEAVVSGLSNREVAGELFLSVHTVEDNLTRVYRKLAVRSRTELARRLAEEGSGQGA